MTDVRTVKVTSYDAVSRAVEAIDIDHGLPVFFTNGLGRMSRLQPGRIYHIERNPDDGVISAVHTPTPDEELELAFELDEKGRAREARESKQRLGIAAATMTPDEIINAAFGGTPSGLKVVTNKITGEKRYEGDWS